MNTSNKARVGFLGLKEGDVVQVTFKRDAQLPDQSIFRELAEKFIQRGKHKPKRYVIDRAYFGKPHDFVPAYGDTNTERSVELLFLPLNDENKTEGEPISFTCAGFNNYDDYAIHFVPVGKMKKEWVWKPETP